MGQSGEWKEPLERNAFSGERDAPFQAQTKAFVCGNCPLAAEIQRSAKRSRPTDPPIFLSQFTFVVFPPALRTLPPTCAGNHNSQACAAGLRTLHRSCLPSPLGPCSHAPLLAHCAASLHACP